MKTLRKLLVLIFAVTGVFLFSSFPAFALTGAHGPMALLATAAAPYATQTKILWVIGLVYAALQGVKKFLPVAGWGAVILNIVFSVGGILTVVQPKDLFSLQTLIAVITAGAGAAGIHGTVRSFTGS